MSKSWLGLQLVLLSCALLLALVAVEGRHHKEEEDSSEEECHCVKRRCCVEECCEKRHSHAAKKGKADKKKHLKESEETRVDSNENYMLKEDQRIMRNLAARSSFSLTSTWRDKAIYHFNELSEGTYYTHREAGQLEFKKAIGVMVYLKVLLANTNCTKTEEQLEAGMEYTRAYLEKEGCQLVPPPEQQKEYCIFDVFYDMRTEKKAVVNHRCGLHSYPKL